MKSSDPLIGFCPGVVERSLGDSGEMVARRVRAPRNTAIDRCSSSVGAHDGALTDGYAQLSTTVR